MAGWPGWEDELLRAVGAPRTAHNRVWLEEWQAAQHTSCAFNPLGARLPRAGSRDCQRLAGGVAIQAYTSAAHGLAATAAQLEQAAYSVIVDALKTGDPFTYPEWQLVDGALGAWGAHTFAARYGDAQRASGGPPPPPAAHPASAAFGGWRHANRALAHDLPSALRRNARFRRESLRRLRTLGRVR